MEFVCNFCLDKHLLPIQYSLDFHRKKKERKTKTLGFVCDIVKVESLIKYQKLFLFTKIDLCDIFGDVSD